MGERRVRPFIGLSAGTLVRRADRELVELAEALGLEGSSVGVALEGVRELLAEAARRVRADRDAARAVERRLRLLEERFTGDGRVVWASGVDMEADGFVLDVVYEPDYVVRVRVPDVVEAYQGMGAALRRALGLLEGVVDPVGGGSPVGGVLGAVRAELEEGARLRVPLEVSLCAPGAEGVDGPVVRLFRAARADCEDFWEGAGAQGLGGAASNSTENAS